MKKITFVLLAFIGFSSLQTNAQVNGTFTNNMGGGDGLWSTASNWTGNIIADGTGVATLQANVDIDVNTSVGSLIIQFSSTISSASNSTLTLTTPNVNDLIYNTSGSGTVTIDCNITMSSTGRFHNDAGSKTIFAAGNTISSSTFGITLNNESLNAFEFNGVVTGTGLFNCINSGSNGGLTLGATSDLSSFTGGFKSRNNPLIFNSTSLIPAGNTIELEGSSALTFNVADKFEGDIYKDTQASNTSVVTFNQSQSNMGFFQAFFRPITLVFTAAATNVNFSSYTTSDEEAPVNLKGYSDGELKIGSSATVVSQTILDRWLIDGSEPADGTITQNADGYILVGPTNTWVGGAVGNENDWATTTNWSLGTVPVATDNVIIPTGITNYPTISTAAVASTFILKEEASLLFSGGTLTASNGFTYQRTLNADTWYLMSSPINGESYDDGWIEDSGIASGVGSNRGISTYDNTSLDGSTGHWRYFQAAGTATSFNAAQGYGIRRSSGSRVSFVGTGVYTADQTIGISQSVSNFSLVSNPFTGYLNLGAFFTDNSAANLLAQNSIWVWDATNSTYDVKTSAVDGAYEVAHGQAFFVEAGTVPGNVTFDIDDVSHQGTDTFQKTSNSSIKIFAEDENNIFRNARIYFKDFATTGFDNGYDGQLFGGASHSFALFSELLDSNSKKYQVQSLPTSLQESAIIPLGLIAEAGKTITFSVEALNLPEGIKVFVEDRLEDTYTRIDESNATYKVTLTNAIDGLGRFYLHTSQSALSVNDDFLESVSIYKTNNSTLRIAGLSQGQATVKLFNMLGKQMMNVSFESKGVKDDVSLPNLAKGIYIVQLETEKGKLNKKIILE